MFFIKIEEKKRLDGLVQERRRQHWLALLMPPAVSTL